MIIGNRNGKAGKKCNRVGSNDYECHVEEKRKVLLAIPQVQSATAPSLIITETGEFVKIFNDYDGFSCTFSVVLYYIIYIYAYHMQ